MSYSFEAEDARWLREQLATMTSDDPVRQQRVLQVLNHGIKREAAEMERIDAQTRAFLAEAVPALERAAEEGTYVAYPQYPERDAVQLPDETREFVHWWAPASRILREEGRPLQLVHKARSGGTTARGYRLRPEGDERDGIELEDLRRENGRCGHCGRTREEGREEPCLYMGRASVHHSFNDEREGAKT